MTERMMSLRLPDRLVEDLEVEMVHTGASSRSELIRAVLERFVAQSQARRKGDRT